MTPEEKQALQQGAIEDLWVAYARELADSSMNNEERADDFIGCLRAACGRRTLPDYVTQEWLIDIGKEQEILFDDEHED